MSHSLIRFLSLTCLLLSSFAMGQSEAKAAQTFSGTIYGSFVGAYADDETARQKTIDSAKANCQSWHALTKASAGTEVVVSNCSRLKVSKVYLLSGTKSNQEYLNLHVVSETTSVADMVKNATRYAGVTSPIFQLLGYRAYVAVHVYSLGEPFRALDERNNSKTTLLTKNRDDLVKGLYAAEIEARETCDSVRTEFVDSTAGSTTVKWFSYCSTYIDNSAPNETQQGSFSVASSSSFIWQTNP